MEWLASKFSLNRDKYSIYTIAGTMQRGYSDGVCSRSLFDGPCDVTFDTTQNFLYVSDSYNNCIRRISTIGQVSTLSKSCDTVLKSPRGIEVDKTGAVFVCDSGNHSIRKIFANGAIKTWAGTGKPGFEDGTSASFTNPEGICIDSVGNLFVTEEHRVRKIDVDGTVSTIAGKKQNLHQDGSARAALFNYPGGICISRNQELLVVDRKNYCIRAISNDGYVTTFAGHPKQSELKDGSIVSARFKSPYGITMDDSQNIYVTDENCVRMITPCGHVKTITGNLDPGFEDKWGLSARFDRPMGLTFGLHKNLYVADYNNNSIRVVMKEL